MTSLINVNKFEDKLRKIIQLNNNGSVVYSNKTTEALALSLSKSEVIEAFKADVDETAKDLISALPIIYSIKNGIVNELKTLDNSVETFFESSFDKESNTITLSGAKFDLSKETKVSKSDIVDTIYIEVFNTTRKEVNTLLKSLIRYDKTSDSMEKTLLYPSVVLADEIIAKMGLINAKFNEFRQAMSFNEKILFSATFNRSGIEDVIQNSTFIDKEGVKQTIPAHNKHAKYVQEIAYGIKNNLFKYIESVEIDGDGDVEKVLRLINQIERLKINCDFKFTLKFRKLGNYKARGLFMRAGLIVAEDVRDTSALLHEIAHFIHLTNNEIYTSDFVNYMIEKMSKRIDFNNLNVDEVEKEEILSKIDYYTNPKEVLARTMEIASLFASESSKLIIGSDEFDLIKSRSYYKDKEGIYFNFSSFDTKTIEELSKLFTMFYETTFDEIKNTNINNFYKIDTNYKRTVFDNATSVRDALRVEAIRAEKDRRTLYGMVNADNIQMIIDNRDKNLSLDNLCALIFGNLNYCGGHNSSLTAEEWVEVKESKSKMVLMMIDLLKSTKSEFEFLEYLYVLDRNKILNIMEQACSVSGFSIKWRMSIKKLMNEKYPDGYFKQFAAFYGSIARNVFNIASSEIVNNYEQMKKFVSENKYFLSGLKDGVMSEDNLLRHSLDLLEENLLSYMSYPREVFNSREFVLNFFMKNPSKIDAFDYVSDDLKSNADFITLILNFFVNNCKSSDLKIAFGKLPSELHKNKQFVSYFLAKEESIIECLSKEDKKLYIDSNTKEIQESEAKKPEAKKPRKNKKKSEPVAENNYDTERFEKLIESAQIEDFKHTKTGEDLKVLKIEEKLDKNEFIEFNKYLVQNNIAYYSKWAKGFVVKNIEKLTVAASLGSVVYAPELLEVFASGKLF